MKKERDFTEGNLSGHLVALAVPLVFGNILQEFYNTIDAFVVGRYAGKEEFAAIGIAGTVMNLFLFALVGCCTGFSVLFAQAYGQKDMGEVRRQHFSALAAGLGCTLFLMLLGIAGMRPLLAVLQTPTELQGYVATYLHWIFLSLPAAFLYNLQASLLRAAGDTKAALYVLAAAVGMNLILDLVLVAGCGRGIEGAAMATALTQLFSAVVCFLYLRVTHPEMLLRREDCHPESVRLRHTLKFGLVSSMHQCSLYLGKMFVQGAVNTGGTEVIAAYTAATRIEGFANSFGTSGSTATSILTAQNYGAGRKERVEQTYHCSLRWLIGLGTVSAVLMLVFAPQAIALMLGAENGIAFDEAVRYLRIVSLFYVFCFTGNTFVGYFDGIGKIQIPFFGATGHITMRVILSWLLFRYMSLDAVALATGLGWVCANTFWGVMRNRIRKNKKTVG